MRKTYKQMLEEIEQLKHEAEEVRRREVEEVIARIKVAIAFYNLTPEDLGFGSKAVGTKAAKSVPPPPSPPKKKRKSRYTERPLAGPKL